MTGEIIIDTSANAFTEKNKFNKQSFQMFDLLGYFSDVVDRKVTGWYYTIDNIIFYHSIVDLTRNIDGDLCELGVAFGKSAVAISLLKTKEETLHLFDLFCADVKLEDAQNNLEKYGNNSNLKWHVLDLMNLDPNSIEFNKKIKFLHIDSCHQHTAMLRDLNNFVPKMHDDGIIAIDDWNDPTYPGVNTAVTQFLLSCAGKNWKFFCIGSNKAYLCQKHNVEKYRSSVIKLIRTKTDGVINSSDVMGNECLLLCSNNNTLSKEEIDQLENNTYVRKYT